MLRPWLPLCNAFSCRSCTSLRVSFPGLLQDRCFRPACPWACFGTGTAPRSAAACRQFAACLRLEVLHASGSAVCFWRVVVFQKGLGSSLGRWSGSGCAWVVVQVVVFVGE